MTPRWSIVIPAFNEACRFPSFLDTVVAYFEGRDDTRGFGFDVELLLLARATGCRIVEVPVTWADQPESKFGVLRHGPGMLWQIVRTRLPLGRHR